MNNEVQKESGKIELTQNLYKNLVYGYNVFTDFWKFYSIIVLIGGVLLMSKLRLLNIEGIYLVLIAITYLLFGMILFNSFDKIKERIIMHLRSKHFPEDYQLILALNQGLETVTASQKKQLYDIFSRIRHHLSENSKIRDYFKNMTRTWRLEILSETLKHTGTYIEEEILDGNIYFQELLSMLKETNEHSILEKYSASEFTAIREAVASNQCIDTDLLAKLSLDKSSRVLKAISKNPKTNLETLIHIAINSSGDTRQAVLKAPKMVEYLNEASNTSSTVLIMKLADSELDEIREKIAANPKTPPSLLMKFKNDKYMVKMCMVKNPSTPEYFLGDLANNDPDENVRKAINANPLVVGLVKIAQTSSDLNELISLSTKPFVCVREQVALSKFTPTETLQNLGIDMAIEVRTANAKNPNTPYETVSQFLSKLPREEVVTSEIIGEGESRVDDHDGYRIETSPIFKREKIYNEDSVISARKFLVIHSKDKQQKIIEMLKDLNPDLHTALINAGKLN